MFSIYFLYECIWFRKRFHWFNPVQRFIISKVFSVNFCTELSEMRKKNFENVEKKLVGIGIFFSLREKTTRDVNLQEYFFSFFWISNEIKKRIHPLPNYLKLNYFERRKAKQKKIVLYTKINCLKLLLLNLFDDFHFSLFNCHRWRKALQIWICAIDVSHPFYHHNSPDTFRLLPPKT